jgi:hypothetical protein
MIGPVVILYCERVGRGLFAEPLNAFSNAGFFVAAALAWRELRRASIPGRRWDLYLAVALLVAVGIGSSLWHTLATPWAQVTDSGPIALLVTVLLGSVLRRVFGLSALAIAGALVLLEVVSGVLAAVMPTTLGGSVTYAPALTGLVLLAVAASVRGSPWTRDLVIVGVLFSVSLVLRTIDRGVCPHFPWGTHFLWHLINAVLLFRLLSLLTRCSARRGVVFSAA